MVDKTIYIYGEIGYEVTAFDVVSQLQDLEPKSDVTVKIHSPGGNIYDGFAIHETLINSGHNITTVGEGLVGSVATVIFLAGKVRQLTSNSRPFFHMPLVQHAEGNASELKEKVEELLKWEAILINFYTARLKIGKRKIKELLDKDTDMSAEEALEIGFATEILTPIMAITKFKTKDIMKLSEIVSKLMKGNGVEGLILADEAGQKLNIVTPNNIPDVGQEVIINGVRAEDGEHFIPAIAKIIKIKGGKIDEITIRNEDADGENAINDLKTFFDETILGEVKPISNEIDKLNVKVSKMEKLITAQQLFIETQSKQIETDKKEFTDYKSEVEASLRLVVSNYVPPQGGTLPTNAMKMVLTPMEKLKQKINATK